MNHHRPLFCIIDASSFIFRAFYAVRPLSNKSGLPTNAVYGFANMVFKVLEDIKPKYIAFVYDTKHPSFRKELFPEYKANRSAMPEDLVPQIPYIKKFIETMGLPSFERAGFEADDVIATLAHEAAITDHEADVCIVTSDKDLMQLVNDRIFMFDTMKDLKITSKEVEDKMGVPPSLIADYLGLVGDSSDNIPGVKGIGPKSAAELLKQFGSLNGVYENLESVKKDAQRQKLTECKDMAFLSRELATVKRDLNINEDWHKLKCEPKYGAEFTKLLEELEFHGLLKKIKSASASTTIANPTSETVSFGEPGQLGQLSLDISSPDLVAAENAIYEKISSIVELKKVFEKYASAQEVSFDTETASLSFQNADIVGFSFCVEPAISYYVPLRHLDEAGNLLPDQCALNDAIPLLQNFLKNKKLIGQNLKFDMNVLRAQGIEISSEQISFDTMVASYVLHAEDRHNLDALANKYLNHKNISYEELCGTGKNARTFASVALDEATKYAAEDAHVALLLEKQLKPQLLTEPDLYKVFTDIDMPLVSILADIEWQGVSIDTPLLEKMSHDFTIQLAMLEKSAHQIAGEEFNLSSPKQLQKILFEKLKLPAFKKTKTGYSTDVDVLEKLAFHHDLPKVILENREVSKLKSTYVDVLPSLVHPKTKRVHASFNQAVAATGRLSSSDPNLQNIPIRTEMGRKIREAFVAREGYMLLGADYSQIELRILAHMSQDQELCNAFANGEDIHTATAAIIFGVEKEKVDSDQRRKAKAINFGILYGKTAFGLSEELGIPRGEAAQIIEKYFSRYPTIKNFISNLTMSAHQKGYAETLYGRRRRIEGIQSQNKMIRAMADRMAVNTPIQGTAADLIKIAMHSLSKKLKEAKMESKIIMQVHDELILEVPTHEIERAKKIVKEEMEHVGRMPGLPQISVPLTVDLGVAENWLKL